ncbi:MAG: DNA-binding protein WhiA [Erysipelotrichaceae bacterium]|nr:DNA-binding protein WhiA [Erysipelotrichaceae bacterium]
MKKTSFAKVVKDEIVSSDLASEAKKKAFLSAYIKINGSVIFRNKKSVLLLKFTDAKVAKFLYSLLLEIYRCDAHLSYVNKNKSRHYNVEVEDADELIDDLGISFLEGKISKDIVYDDDTIAGYLAGVFLSTGSVNSPETSNYHLEMSLNNENYAKWLLHLFPKYSHTNIEPRLIKRRDKYVIYIKKSDQIADFLLLVGAVSACMDFENVRIDRDFVNNANRLTNLDTANMSKTVKSGKRQQEEIKFLIDKYGLENLGNQKVQLVIKYRLEMMSAPLEEIASLVSMDLNTHVSKSNINHIFRKLHERYLESK